MNVEFFGGVQEPENENRRCSQLDKIDIWRVRSSILRHFAAALLVTLIQHKNRCRVARADDRTGGTKIVVRIRRK